MKFLTILSAFVLAFTTTQAIPTENAAQRAIPPDAQQRTDLLQDIHRGKPLRHVQQPKIDQPFPTLPAEYDRMDHLRARMAQRFAMMQIMRDEDDSGSEDLENEDGWE